MLDPATGHAEATVREHADVVGTYFASIEVSESTQPEALVTSAMQWQRQRLGDMQSPRPEDLLCVRELESLRES